MYGIATSSKTLFILKCFFISYIRGVAMITTEYISVLQSFLSSVLGLGIVFLSLIFLAIFVTIVSKVISALEKNLPTAAPAPAAAPAAVSQKPAAGSEAVKVAVIAAAISEERRESVNSFVITNIKKL